jgi:uncharacterized membrane protein (UPF0127 family)
MTKNGTDALLGPRGAIASKLHWATNPLTRYRGLRGRAPLADDEALILRPCRQVHTFGLRASIDAVFCDDRWNVLHVVSLRPRRMSRFVRRARSCIELAGGRAAACDVAPGVRLTIEAGSS